MPPSDHLDKTTVHSFEPGEVVHVAAGVGGAWVMGRYSHRDDDLHVVEVDKELGRFWPSEIKSQQQAREEADRCAQDNLFADLEEAA